MTESTVTLRRIKWTAEEYMRTDYLGRRNVMKGINSLEDCRELADQAAAAAERSNEEVSADGIYEILKRWFLNPDKYLS